MANGQQIAKENLIKIERWIEERNLAGDVEGYVRGKQLNRSEIASSCGFALSVLRQNPAVKDTLITFEDALRKKGILPKLDGKKAKTPNSTAKKRKPIAGDNQRIQELEEKNENLRIKIRQLEKKLEAESLFELHLFETGRAIKP